MCNNCCKSCCVPCITVTGESISLSGSQTVIAVAPFEGAIPPCGRIDFCVPPVFPANNTNPVVIDSGSRVYQVINRCADVLRTDQLSRHCCKFALHLQRPSDPLETLENSLLRCLDRLCPSRYLPASTPRTTTPDPAENAGVASAFDG